MNLECALIERATDGEAAFVEDVGVNHRGFNIAMAEQFLNRLAGWPIAVKSPI